MDNVSPKSAAPVSVKSTKLASGIRLIARDNGSATANLKFAVMCGSSAESLLSRVAQSCYPWLLLEDRRIDPVFVCRDLENAGASLSATGS